MAPPCPYLHGRPAFGTKGLGPGLDNSIGSLGYPRTIKHSVDQKQKHPTRFLKKEKPQRSLEHTSMTEKEYGSMGSAVK